MAAASANEAVTSSAIRIGVPYIDFSSLAAEGVKLTQGSFPDAYGALSANVNAHGGLNGPKIVAYDAPVNLSNGTVGVPVSFDPGRDFAIGPVYVGKYSAAVNQLVFSPTPAAS